MKIISAAKALKKLYPACTEKDIARFTDILSNCDERTANIVCATVINTVNKQEKGDIKSE